MGHCIRVLSGSPTGCQREREAADTENLTYPPYQGLTSLEAARNWVQQFVRWYHHEHRHSAIQFVTPHERHEGLDPVILESRKAVYE